MDTQTIKAAVATYFHLQSELLSLRTKDRKICFPRQIAHYLSCRMTPLSLGQIGYDIGKKDHATVMHSRKVINNMIQTKYRHNGILIKDLVQEIEDNISCKEIEPECWDRIPEEALWCNF